MIGSSIMNWKPEEGWMAQVGKPLIEAGVIYIIFRLLFLKQGDEVDIEELRKENAQLKQSVSVGVADNYFWNFLHSVVGSLKEYDQDDENSIPQCVLVEKEDGKDKFNDGFTLK